MFGRKSERIHDERIEKESNKPAAVMFYVTTMLLVLCITAKIVCKLPVQVYALEIGCLAVSLIYAIADKARNGILWMKEKDDALVTINNKILARAYMIDFWMLSVGEVVFIVVFKEYFWWVSLYLFTLLVPALVITILSLKKGWLVWGGKKRVVIGSLFFGVFVGWPQLFQDGTFQPLGIIWMLGLGAMWGVMFYFLMLGFIKMSEKKADSIAQAAEVEEDEVNDIEE